jgi:hypothetical protein
MMFQDRMIFQGRLAGRRPASLSATGLLMLLLASGSLLLAEISGVVTNDTTGKPQAGVVINLVHPGENGMQTLATVTTGADGSFKIDQPLPPPPALLQATYQAVQYNLVVPPGRPSTGIGLSVYNATDQKAQASLLQQHLLVLEPTEQGIRANETFLIQNNGKTTFLDPVKGSVEFSIPKDAQGAKVTIEAPGGMPITRAPEKTSDADVFKVSYPVKPGETVYEIGYTLPPSKTFTGKVLGKIPMLLVTPESVQLTGTGVKEEGVKDLGQNGTRARVYEVSADAPSFQVSIDGVGLLATGGAEDTGQQGEDDGSPKPKAGNARLYERLPWVLGLTFSILGLGGVLLYRRSPA